jgi:hypothetical protein
MNGAFSKQFCAGEDALEGPVEADNRFAVVSTESGDPIVILPEAVPRGADFPVQISCLLGNPIVEAIYAPILEVLPGFVGAGEGHRHFGEADNVVRMTRVRWRARKVRAAPAEPVLCSLRR